jgi:hypothetical protein
VRVPRGLLFLMTLSFRPRTDGSILCRTSSYLTVGTCNQLFGSMSHWFSFMMALDYGIGDSFLDDILRLVDVDGKMVEQNTTAGWTVDRG